MPRGKVLEVAVEAPTKVSPMTGLLIGTVAICSAILIGAFSASFASNMAGLVRMAGTTTTPAYYTCWETAENMTNVSSTPLYSSFVQNNAPIWQVQYFNIYTLSTAKCAKGGSSSYYQDKCLIDVCVGTSCKTSSTPSCLPTDKNCRLQEGFIVTTSSATSTMPGWYQTSASTWAKVSNWLYYCPNGCANGACKADPICTDSDIKSEGGDDLFMAGFTMGLDQSGKFVSTTDYCVASSSTSSPIRATSGPFLMEYECLNNRVNGSLFSCANGCKNGACKQIIKLVPGDIIKSINSSAVYFYGSDKKRHLFPTPGVYNSWLIPGSSVKVITNDQMNGLSMGENMKVRPVGYIVKFDSSSKYYAVLPNLTLQPINNSTLLPVYYGQYWSNRLINIPSAFEANYTKTSSGLNGTSTWPNGVLIKYTGSENVYYLQAGKKRLITPSAFVLNNLPSSFIITPFPISYPTGTSITGKEKIFTMPY